MGKIAEFTEVDSLANGDALAGVTEDGSDNLKIEWGNLSAQIEILLGEFVPFTSIPLSRFNPLDLVQIRERVSAGETDIYQVPPGKFAAFGAWRILNPGAGGAVAFTWKLRTSDDALIFTLQGPQNINNEGATQGSNFITNGILDAGEVLITSFPSNGPVMTLSLLKLYNKADFPNLHFARIALETGENILLDCPPGKRRLILGNDAFENRHFNTSFGQIAISNNASAAKTMTGYLIKTGEAKDDTTRVYTRTNPNPGAFGGHTGLALLDAGDQLILDIEEAISAGEIIARFSYLEFDLA